MANGILAVHTLAVDNFRIPWDYVRVVRLGEGYDDDDDLPDYAYEDICLPEVNLFSELDTCTAPDGSGWAGLDHVSWSGRDAAWVDLVLVLGHTRGTFEGYIVREGGVVQGLRVVNGEVAVPGMSITLAPD